MRATSADLYYALQWRHNGRDSVSNHQPHDCLFNRLFRRRSRKHQSLASLAFVRGIHRWIHRTNGQLRGKCFHLMTWSWICATQWRSYAQCRRNVAHKSHKSRKSISNVSLYGAISKFDQSNRNTLICVVCLWLLFDGASIYILCLYSWFLGSNYTVLSVVLRYFVPKLNHMIKGWTSFIML